LTTNRYRDPPGSHRHRCDGCGFVWQHPDTCKGSDAAHTCPGCGLLMTHWDKYDGASPPDPPVRKVVPCE
jgi:hypothetical protein